MTPLTGLYPGTFDPITFGHLGVIERAAILLDFLIVAVASNPGKAPLFSLEERVGMVEEEIEKLRQKGVRAKISVQPFNILLMHFVEEVQAKVIVRGLRAVSDFDYEFQMAGMNMLLNPNVETIFLMASERHQLISSTLVKEVGRLNGDLSQFVPHPIALKIRKKFSLC